MADYIPDFPDLITEVRDLLSFIHQEHQKISQAIAGTLPSELPELHAEPSRLRNFMIVAADGTDWDPGAGQGIYTYYAAAWHKLG